MVTEIVAEIPAATEPVVRKHEFGSSARLWGGFLGRAWLWFLAGCLAVTALPMLFGWRPYVVESGSMQPRINVGDVILASPEHDVAKLLGHVTVFNDPAHPGTVKSHRVVSVNADGTMVTKGDANPTADTVALPMSDVKGIGRLLVRWIGLPLIWVQRGDWLLLALLLGSVWLAAVLVARDQDDVSHDADDGGDASVDAVADGEYDADFDSADFAPDVDSAEKARHPDPMRASAIRGLRHPLRRARHRWHATPAELGGATAARIALVVVGAAALLVPTSQAAFSATTAADDAGWSVATVTPTSYTTDVIGLNPYLYWKLDDSGLNAKGKQDDTAVDSSGNGRDGMYAPPPHVGKPNSAWNMQQAGALPGQSPNLSVQPTGASPTCIDTADAGDSMPVAGPVDYSEIIWFNAPSGYGLGGKLIGLESSQTNISDSTNGGQYDRMLYMDGSGDIWFGVWNTAANTSVAIHSAPGLNDGAWHMAVATMSATSGMALYIDGAEVASDPNTISETETGDSYWRVGCGNLAGWANDWTGPNAPSLQTDYSFYGGLDEAAVFLGALTPANIADLYFDR